MSDPRESDELASESGDEQIEQLQELDERIDDPDQVKGGRRTTGDPCDGGEISPRLS
jgi:hypothetical protein